MHYAAAKPRQEGCGRGARHQQSGVRHRATEHQQVFPLALPVVAWPGFRASERRHGYKDQEADAQSDHRSDQYHHEGSLGHLPRMPSSQEPVQTSGPGLTQSDMYRPS